MKKKHKSYHDRFFEDYKAVRVRADNRKGYRIVYRYIGLWKAWESEKASIAAWKRIFALLELLSICLYVGCAAVDAPVNYAHLASGFGVVSVVPWLAELSGVVRFVFAKAYVRELSLEEIDLTIRVGCTIRAAFTALSGLSGITSAVTEGTAGWLDALLLSGIFASAAISIVIWQLYGRLLVLTYSNIDEKPGNRI